MGYRDGWRPGKFYGQQVGQILDLLEKDFESSSKKFEEYLAVCERLGKEPNYNKMPMDRINYPYEVQLAFVIHDLLPDRWEGMSGSYLGKDWSAVGTYLDAYEIDDKTTTLFFIKAIDIRNANVINEEMQRKRDKQDKVSQAKTTIRKS